MTQTIIYSLIIVLLVGPLFGNYIVKPLVMETLDCFRVDNMTDIGEKREVILSMILSIIYTLGLVFLIGLTLSIMYTKLWMYTLLIIPMAIRTSINNIIEEKMEKAKS